MVIFFFVLIKIARYCFKYFTTNTIKTMFKERYEVSDYSTKFYSFMRFVEDEANKEELELSITD